MFQVWGFHRTCLSETCKTFSKPFKIQIVEKFKTITREDGSRVLICVSFITNIFGNDGEWAHYTQYCAPGKKTFQINVPGKVTPEEILEAKLELYNEMKPNL